MDVVAYCRVSSDVQSEGFVYDLTAQKKDIEEYCAAHDMNILEFLVDEAGIGIRDKRPQLERLLDAEYDQPYQALVVGSTDRIANSTKTYLFHKQTLAEEGVELICIKENSGEAGAGKFAPMLGRS